MNKILLGDCLESLKTLPDQSVHCCVTSPPYYGLRSYCPDKVKIRPDLSVGETEWLLRELQNLGIDAIAEIV